MDVGVEARIARFEAEGGLPGISSIEFLGARDDGADPDRSLILVRELVQSEEFRRAPDQPDRHAAHGWGFHCRGRGSYRPNKRPGPTRRHHHDGHPQNLRSGRLRQPRRPAPRPNRPTPDLLLADLPAIAQERARRTKPNPHRGDNPFTPSCRRQQCRALCTTTSNTVSNCTLLEIGRRCATPRLGSTFATARVWSGPWRPTVMSGHGCGHAGARSTRTWTPTQPAAQPRPPA